MIYPLDAELAKEIGVLEAIILVQFRYWIERNIANEQNYYDGNWWTYNSMTAFQKLFPFASEKSIRNALKHLEEDGLIITGNYNKVQYDRTKWYALTTLGITHTDNFTDSIRQKGQMETAKRANGNGKKGKPIPNKIPNNISSSLRSEDIYKDKSSKSKLRMQDIFQGLPEELVRALNEFIDMRKAIKKVATPRAMELILKDLNKLAGDDVELKIAILEQSIKNSWQGVFNLKEQGNVKTTGYSNTRTSGKERSGMAERIERGYDDFPRFREAGQDGDS